MKDWSVGDKIGFYSLCIAIIAIIISLATPEIREIIGLKENKVDENDFTFKLSEKDKAIILIVRAIQDDALNPTDVNRLLSDLSTGNAPRIIDTLLFVDQSVHGMINRSDIDKLFDKKIKGGFTPPEPLEVECDKKVVYINTCREYFNIPDDCVFTNNYMEKESNKYHVTCSILQAIRDGIPAKKSFLPKKLLEELPQTFLTVGFPEDERSIESLFYNDKTKIKEIGINQKDNQVHYSKGNEFSCLLTELLRIDIDLDGYEDSIISKWFWSGGSMTITELWWITSKSPNKFEIM